MQAPKLDLGLGKLGGDLPKADGLTSNKPAPDGMAPRVGASDVSYQVLEVQHAFEFERGAQGSKPVGGELKELALSGQPPSTPKFTTRVKVKASKPVNTSTTIELVLLDPRGDTAMSGNGELNFRGNKDGQLEWLLDWAPTPRTLVGDYKMLVRIGGQPMGTWPLKVVKDSK